MDIGQGRFIVQLLYRMFHLLPIFYSQCVSEGLNKNVQPIQLVVIYYVCRSVNFKL